MRATYLVTRMDLRFYQDGMTMARFKRIIRHIRQHNLLPNLLSSRRGYYVSQDPNEVFRYVRSMENRGNGILKAAQVYNQPLYLYETDLAS